LDCLPPGHDFQPLMTLYLTDEIQPAEIRRTHSEDQLASVKKTSWPA